MLFRSPGISFAYLCKPSLVFGLFRQVTPFWASVTFFCFKLRVSRRRSLSTLLWLFLRSLMLKLWLTLYKTKAKHSRQYRTNKFRLKNSNPKPKHNHLKRLRAPRQPKFKLARYFVYVPPLFSQLCVVLLGVSSLARDLASVFALIIGPLVYMSIESFAKCCHLCVTLSLLSPC